jgi:hypothetical protein
LFFILYAPCFVPTPLGPQRFGIRNGARQKCCAEDEVLVVGVNKSIRIGKSLPRHKAALRAGAPPAMKSGTQAGK